MAVGPGVGMKVGSDVGYGHVDVFTLHGPTPPAQSVSQSKLFVVEIGSTSRQLVGGSAHQSFGSEPVSMACRQQPHAHTSDADVHATLSSTSGAMY